MEMVNSVTFKYDNGKTDRYFIKTGCKPNFLNEHNMFWFIEKRSGDEIYISREHVVSMRIDHYNEEGDVTNEVAG